MHEETIRRTEGFVRERLAGEASGHDWWHVDRVRRTALRLAEEEGADRVVVELAALLHDVADWKFHGGDDAAGPALATSWLRSLGVGEDVVAHVAEIIAGLSFKGAGVPTPPRTTEGAVVQDADRLDAIGAIGVARAFAYGGFRGQPIYDPDVAVELHQTAERYKRGAGSSVNHFHEKLLLLKDRLNTESARRIAAGRHRFLEEYLERFHAEWEGRA